MQRQQDADCSLLSPHVAFLLNHVKLAKISTRYIKKNIETIIKSQNILYFAVLCRHPAVNPCSLAVVNCALAFSGGLSKMS